MLSRIKICLYAFLTFVASSVPAEEITHVEREKPAEIVYEIHGTVPKVEWQQALRDELKARGIEWYMPYAVCQIFQESRWNRYSDNGRDKGITQQKGIFWDARAARYGMPGADIWDVNAQFHVYACMMSEYLRATGNDIGRALSLYFYGTGDYAPKYVDDVMNHMAYLREVK